MRRRKMVLAAPHRVPVVMECSPSSAWTGKEVNTVQNVLIVSTEPGTYLHYIIHFLHLTTIKHSLSISSSTYIPQENLKKAHI